MTPPLVRLVILGLPPSVNRTRRWSKGRGFDPANRRAVEDKEAFEGEVWAAFRMAYPGAAPLAGPCSLRAVLYPPNRRALDGDNRDKALLDALRKAGVIADDNNRVLPHRDITVWPEPRGVARTEIEIREWSE